MVETVSEKVFNALIGYGYQVQGYNTSGKLEIDPSKSTRFSVAEPNIMVRVDPANNSIRLETSEDLSEHPLREMLKKLAGEYLMDFDYNIFNRRITTKGEQVDISKQQSTMESFSSMSGSSKTSYQPLERVKLIIKHSHPVNEESRGARSRNIQAIYIQAGEERFRLRENSLQAARAMARHVVNGGTPYDETGEGIMTLAEECRKLREFVRYVKNRNLINETNETYVTLAQENIDTIKSTLHRLSGVKTYAAAVESISVMNGIELTETEENLADYFTETQLDDRVSSAVNCLQRAVARKTSYEHIITSAIAEEKFSGLKSLLSENDGISFSSPYAALGHQVSQLSMAAENPTLKTHLQNISKKIQHGGSINHFEYGTIKSCLLGAQEAHVITSAQDVLPESNDYRLFIDSFLI